MNRIGSEYPGLNFLRIGSIDDFNLMETNFKPQVEQFTKDRVNWLQPLEGTLKDIKNFEGMFH